ncbi:MAG: hypothetical protein RL291_886, partial [Pseudomonadota bacterium]
MYTRSLETSRKPDARRGLAVLATMAVGFCAIAGQILRLTYEHAPTAPNIRLAVHETIGDSWARPDIVDRRGRLLATDIEVHSLFADPAQIFDRDEVVEKLTAILPDLDGAQVREALGDRTKRFQWLRRGLTPRLAQTIHDLGIPGLGFRRELLRSYPAGAFAGHVLGGVSIDNRGLGGIEAWLDAQGLTERVATPVRSRKPPVMLSIDTAVQNAVERELSVAMARFQASSAQAVLVDVSSGEIVASASLPGVEPGRLEQMNDRTRPDRVAGGVYELGSVLKVFTLAMAFDSGRVTPETLVDVREPIEIGRFTIKDPHPAGRQLPARDVFVRSSNV